MDHHYSGPERRGRPAVVANESSEDRRSPIRTFVDSVKGMTITPFVRVVSACLAAAFTFMAWDPLFNADDSGYFYTACFSDRLTVMELA